MRHDTPDKHDAAGLIASVDRIANAIRRSVDGCSLDEEGRAVFERDDDHPAIQRLAVLAGFLVDDAARAVADVKALNQDLDARVQMRTRELSRALADLEQASEAKTRFLGNMSHELRTPLNAIIGYASLLTEEAEAEGNADRRDDAAAILSAGQHLLNLINDALDISAVEQGHADLDISDMPLGDFIVGVASVIRGQGEAGENRFEVDVQAERAVLTTDLRRLKQCLLNLIGNAAKFTRSGCVRLIVREDAPGALTFLIEDSGIGMTEAQLAKVFEAFQQADRDIARQHGGTGLGLSITRQLAGLLGGDVIATSRQGVGSCFRLTIAKDLPAAQVRDGASSSRRGPRQDLTGAAA